MNQKQKKPSAQTSGIKKDKPSSQQAPEMPQDRIRCDWVKHPAELLYHDNEWGNPIVDDARHFEFLVLESAQAGLSWLTILLRRSGYQACFADFNADKVGTFTPADVERLMGDSRIIRNRLKIESTITNARAFLDIQAQYGSFNTFIWDYMDGRQLQSKHKSIATVQATTPLAEKIAKDLKKRGFRFLGPTAFYAYMQAAGLVNDHITSCFRYELVQAEAARLGML